MKTALSITFLITFLIAVLCLSATAGPISSLPPPVVKRPAPLLSPSHSGSVKNKPMAKTTSGTFIPASVPMYPISVSIINDFNFFHCDTNDLTCVLYDVTHVSAIAASSVPVTIEMSDDITEEGWTWVAQFGAAPYERVVEFEWYLPVDQRPVSRFFRAVRTAPSDSSEGTFAAASAGGVRISPNVKGVRAWSRPRK